MSAELFGHTANTLKAEGAYLLAAQRAAEAFTRRILATRGPIRLQRDEALDLAHTFERVVAICSGYHCDEAGRPAA